MPQPSWQNRFHWLLCMRFGQFILFSNHEKILFHSNSSFNVINIRRLCWLGKLNPASFINFILVLTYLWWYHKNLRHSPWLMRRHRKFFWRQHNQVCGQMLLYCHIIQQLLIDTPSSFCLACPLFCWRFCPLQILSSDAQPNKLSQYVILVSIQRNNSICHWARNGTKEEICLQFNTKGKD